MIHILQVKNDLTLSLIEKRPILGMSLFIGVPTRRTNFDIHSMRWYLSVPLQFHCIVMVVNNTYDCHSPPIVIIG